MLQKASRTEGLANFGLSSGGCALYASPKSVRMGEVEGTHASSPHSSFRQTTAKVRSRSERRRPATFTCKSPTTPEGGPSATSAHAAESGDVGESEGAACKCTRAEKSGMSDLQQAIDDRRELHNPCILAKIAILFLLAEVGLLLPLGSVK